jgi:hypothetical protein
VPYKAQKCIEKCRNVVTNVVWKNKKFDHRKSRTPWAWKDIPVKKPVGFQMQAQLFNNNGAMGKFECALTCEVVADYSNNPPRV